MTSKQKTILITGIPRSGTSLITKLMSQQDNTLCFSEPNWLKEIRHENQTSQEFKEQLLIRVASIRNEIKKGNPIEITVKKGTLDLPGNYFQREGKNIQNIKETIKINVEHSEDLTICIKSNTLFTACIKPLLNEKSWRVLSIVRDPLYVLMSWRSLNIPISYGKITIGEIYSSEIREIVKENDLLLKQVKILNWFFKQYQINGSEVLKYEDIISNPNKILLRFFQNVKVNNDQLKLNNNQDRYGSIEKDNLIDAINNCNKNILLYYKI